MLGRYCDLMPAAPPETDKLSYGDDFRLPQFRREVFLRFYEFHLKYKAHPGAVYYVMPFLAQELGWGPEEKLWFAFINGNTQNPVTSWLIFRRYPSLATAPLEDMATWFGAQWGRLAFDTDRRYAKKLFVQAVAEYRGRLCGRPQTEFWGELLNRDPWSNFRAAWRLVEDKFVGFGRLSTFSYLEYLRIMGMPIECDQLFLHDMQGSKSHRNGLCKVLGRDDLDWHDSNPNFNGRYGPRMIEWLAEEGEKLVSEALVRLPNEPHVGYFTLESTLCTYKGWHRPNRRYPNVYNDMFRDRILAAETTWDERLELFWRARRAHLPAHLRLEDNPADCGCKPAKQNHYRLTGQPIMMDRDWDCFRNDFNDAVRRQQGEK